MTTITTTTTTTSAVVLDQDNLTALEWAQQALAEYTAAGLVAKPTDYSRSWQNGVGLLCLVHRVDASLVGDMHAMHAWLSAPHPRAAAAAADAGAYLRALRHLKIVYSSDPAQWLSTCERALRLAAGLGLNPPLPKDVAAAADPRAVERLLNAFRTLSTSSTSTSTSASTTKNISSDDSFSFEQTPPPKDAPLLDHVEKQAPSILGLKSFWDVFGAVNKAPTVEKTLEKVDESPIFTKPSSPKAPPSTPTTQKTFEEIFTETALVSTPEVIDEKARDIVVVAPAAAASDTSITSTTNVWLNKKRSFAEVVKNVPESVVQESTITTTTTSSEFEVVPLKEPSDSPSAPSVVDSSPTPSVRDLARGFNERRSSKHAIAPRRSSLIQKKPSASDHFKTIVTTTTTKTITNDKGEQEVVVEKNVEVVEDDANVPEEVVTSTAPVVKVVETTTENKEETAVVATVAPAASGAVDVNPTVATTEPPKSKEVVATTSANTTEFNFLEKAASALTPLVDAFKAAPVVHVATPPPAATATIAETSIVVDASSSKEATAAPLTPKQKKRALVSKFKPSGPGVLFSDYEESSDDETPIAKTPIATPNEINSNVATTTTTTTSSTRTVENVTPPSSASSTPVEKEKPKTRSFTAHYLTPTVSSTHHAHSASPSPSDTGSDKKITKSQMLATIKEMQAGMDLVARKRGSITIPAVKKDAPQPPSVAPMPSSAKSVTPAVTPAVASAAAEVGSVKASEQTSATTPTTAERTVKSTTTVTSATTTNTPLMDWVQSAVAPSAEKLNEFVNAVSTATASISTAAAAPSSVTTREVAAPTSTALQTVTTTTTTSTAAASPAAATPSSSSVAPASPKTAATTSTAAPKKPVIYSETYRNHISESDAVLSVCESELKARHTDYKQFSRSDLEAWFEEIKATSMMFVDIGGQVLDAEWKEHGFDAKEEAPHVKLVERARRIVEDLEKFKVLIA
ncbi:hypothetical protein BDR26DRAFT_899877 [Obelidium mucronatum]|nr:hypothetical protein BDR26DRAFT_899877 [Obelidium mucronatum]